MTKSHPVTDLEQTGRPRRCQRPGRNPELRRGVPQKLWITERLCRRHQQQTLGVLRKRVELPQEALLNPG